MTESARRLTAVCAATLGVAVSFQRVPDRCHAMRCFAQQAASARLSPELAEALEAIHRDRAGIREGFEMLDAIQLGNRCPDQLLALVHERGNAADEIVSRLGSLIAARKLKIHGKQLVAEYAKAGQAGRRARQALCAFAAYQTGRTPSDVLPSIEFLGQGHSLASVCRKKHDCSVGIRPKAATGGGR